MCICLRDILSRAEIICDSITMTSIHNYLHYDRFFHIIFLVLLCYITIYYNYNAYYNYISLYTGYITITNIVTLHILCFITIVI